MAESTGILLLDAEDNSESGLTITEEGSNNFSITTGAAQHGTYGYQFDFDGTNNELWASDTFTEGSDIYCRCYFYIPSSVGFTAEGLYTLSALLYDGTDYLLYPRFYYHNSTLFLERIDYRHNTGTANSTIYATVSLGTRHYIEIRYKAGNGDGEVQCWFNGTSVKQITGLTNDNYAPNSVRFGQTRSGVISADSPFYIDDIKIDSSSIGEYTESGGTGNSYYYQQQQM